MTTEGNKRILALACTVADLKAENMELVERVHQLVNDYNEVVRQLEGKEKRKDEDPATKTLIKLRQTEEQCYKLERKNQNLKRFEKAIHAFVKDKNIYMKKNNECPYHSGDIPVCSTYCLECESCLGVLGVHGVICERRLKEASVSLPDIG